MYVTLDDVVYNQSVNATSTLDKRRPDLRDELGYIAPPNRKLPPVPGSNYNTCDRIKRGTISKNHFRHPLFLILHAPVRDTYQRHNTYTHGRSVYHGPFPIPDLALATATILSRNFAESPESDKMIIFAYSVVEIDYFE